MSEAEKLMADVPARDPLFVLGVMTRIEQRRFRRELARTGGLTAIAIILLALVMPKLDFTWLGNLSPANELAIGAALMALSIMGSRLSRTLKN